MKERGLNVKLSIVFRIFGALAVCLLPFGVLFWLNPLTGTQTIGNDYVNFSIDQQIALQYSLKHGSFPLFAPGFAGGGHSAAALTLGQLHHPISHLASHLPGYWTGQALQVNTALRLLFIGVTHLILLILLLRLKVPGPAAFAISFVTVYNLRMLDMFRYGASLENYLGFLLLVAALSFDYIKPSRVRSPAFIVIATYLLVCGGHPQIMYLGLLGAGGIALVLPFALSAVQLEPRPSFYRLKRFYLRAAAFTGTGIAMSSAYVLPFYFEFIKSNSARVDRNYGWSLAYSDSWGGAFNSFFRPLHSDVHGAFGSASIILLVLLIPLVLAFVKRPPKILFVLFGGAVAVFLISIGRATPLHYLFWRFMPLFGSFRTPGRINMVLPFVFLLLLSWWFRNGNSLEFRRIGARRITPVSAVSFLTLLVYIIYNVFLIDLVPKPGHYIPAEVNKHPFSVHVAAYWTGMVVLGLVGLYGFFSKSRVASWVLGILLCAGVVLQCGIELRNGTWMVAHRTKPTLAEIDRKMKNKLAVLGLAGFGMESAPIAEQMKRSALQTDPARFYRTYRTAKSLEAAYKSMAAHPWNATPTAVSDKPAKLVSSCDKAGARCLPDVVRMTYASYNKVSFDVSAAEDGLLTAALPFLVGWRAAVDDKPYEAVRAEGYMAGVFVPKGNHHVTLAFHSIPSLAGFGLFSAAILGMAVFFALGSAIRARIAILAGGAALATLVFVLPYRSLYVGDDLGTRPRWTTSELPDKNNIALFKTAEMSSTESIERPYDYYAGRAVDGDGKTAFKTDNGKPNPWWKLDLGRPYALGEIRLQEQLASPIKRLLPITVSVSMNGKTYETVERLTTLPPKKPVRIETDGRRARYIRIQGTGSTSLSIKEVEVFEKSAASN